MKLVPGLLFGLIASCFIACSTPAPATDTTGTRGDEFTVCLTPGPDTGTTDKRPDGFGLTYEWTAGSLPPPGHYEYNISVGPTGQGEMVMS